jgi:hypothetical protein
VLLKTDPTQPMFDRFDRLLAYVRLPSGRQLNRPQVAAGVEFGAGRPGAGPLPWGCLGTRKCTNSDSAGRTILEVHDCLGRIG